MVPTGIKSRKWRVLNDLNKEVIRLKKLKDFFLFYRGKLKPKLVNKHCSQEAFPRKVISRHQVNQAITFLFNSKGILFKRGERGRGNGRKPHIPNFFASSSREKFVVDGDLSHT